ncbi:MAG TPA: aerotolerance regulator BatA [Planctomycetaceae bacterium]|nr:aerotolerance regulator BatA [Planctomycetaceae bacterium]
MNSLFFNIPFRYPMALLIGIVPLALTIWVWVRSGRNVVVPFDHGTQRSGNWLWTLVNFAELLPAILALVIILILCGPVTFGVPESKRKLTNIYFCVDISGSMTASFGEGSRYDASMTAINDFLEFREGDAFALLFFGNNVMDWVPLTTDSSAIRYAPPYMRPENAPPGFGGTEIGKALLACQRRLKNAAEEGDRMIILISDGYSSDLSGDNATAIAKQLRSNDITVYAIHIAESGIPDEIVNITSFTGGEVFNPGDPEGLQAIFQRIDAMEQAELEKTVADLIDNYYWYCIVGLGILVTCLLCSFGLRYTPW